MILVFIYFVIVNTITYMLYAIDKMRAKKKKDTQRIPERMLLIMTAIGGSVGALIAMKVHRHKIRKIKFYLGVPLILTIHVAIFIAYLYVSQNGINL